MSGNGDTGVGDEGVDLDPATQRAILDKERALGGDHFAFLGLAPDASPEAAREAYYALSRLFHPDRYFRKKLGPFRVKLERIFQRLVEAEQVLTDPAKREAYLRANPQLRPSAPTVDPERAAERRSRMARHPYLMKPGHARELAQKADQLSASGQEGAALEALRDALKLDPRSAEIARKIAEVEKRIGQRRQRNDVSRGEALEAKGDHAGALKVYVAALQSTPTAELNAKVAGMMLATGAAAVARPHAEKAVSMAPGNIPHRVLLAEVLLALGEKRAARKELDVVLERDPTNARAAQLIKKTRFF